MPKARLDGRRVTRCSNMPGYKKKIENGAYLNGQTEFYDREAALCQEVTKWIDSKRYKIVDLLLSPQGMARGYLSKWVEWAYKNGMPTLPAPSEYANEEERDQKLRANFTALVDHVCAAKKGVTGLLLTLKGSIGREKGTEFVLLVEPNGEVDRVMRIWPALEDAYEDVMDTEVMYFDELAKIGLDYVHPNEE